MSCLVCVTGPRVKVWVPLLERVAETSTVRESVGLIDRSMDNCAVVEIVFVDARVAVKLNSLRVRRRVPDWVTWAVMDSVSECDKLGGSLLNESVPDLEKSDVVDGEIDVVTRSVLV